MHWVTRAVSLLALVVLGVSSAEGQTRRALLVGIDRYDAVPAPRGSTAQGSARGTITNLSGAVNDATAMSSLLQSRFGFTQQNLTMLVNERATREQIMAAIDRLLAESNAGDVVVFFYAGHGSQRRNSLSPEASGLDQTLVPADANAGAFDIRDKELARAFNRFIDKNVELVLILDSCHSGSISRGAYGSHGEVRSRWAAIDPRDALDPGVEAGPAERGALVISAAQDYEEAKEMRDDNGQQHGVFTSALITTLNSVPLTESASDVFRRVRARIQTNAIIQEPVIDGTADRLQRPVFGGAAATRGRTAVAVQRVLPNGSVLVQGGPLLGLREGAVLRKVGTAGADSALRLRVDSVLNVSLVRARVTAGEASRIGGADLLELERWRPPDNLGLSLAIVGTGPEASVLQRVAADVSELRGSPGIEWLDDPAAIPADSMPLVVMHYARGRWELRPEIGAATPLRTPTATAVRTALAQLAPRRTVRFLLSLPPTPQVAAAVRSGVGEESGVVLTAEAGSAAYVLIGSFRDGALRYSLVQPNASQALANASPLPLRTEWVHSDSAQRLVDHAFTLARVRSWLLLESPPDEGSFPYRLTLRRMSDSALQSESPFVGGESYEVVLVASGSTEDVTQRRVYVFGIDSKGRGQLLFPQAQVENRFPLARQADGSWPRELSLGRTSRFRITPPYGTDALVLVTSDAPIGLDAFRWEGVRNVRTPQPGGTLGALLESAGKTRSFDQDVPVNWSIQRLILRSEAPRAPGGQ